MSPEKIPEADLKRFVAAVGLFRQAVKGTPRPDVSSVDEGLSPNEMLEQAVIIVGTGTLATEDQMLIYHSLMGEYNGAPSEYFP